MDDLKFMTDEQWLEVYRFIIFLAHDIHTPEYMVTGKVTVSIGEILYEEKR